jgi:hypothetical protein
LDGINVQIVVNGEGSNIALIKKIRPRTLSFPPATTLYAASPTIASSTPWGKINSLVGIIANLLAPWIFIVWDSPGRRDMTSIDG